MPGRCLSCHRDIAWLVERDRGFHGSRDVKGTACATCHPDHAGRDFELIRWPDGSAEKFDHRRAGWPLQQRHAEARCEKCHSPRFQASPAAHLSARKTPGGWTGLEQECTSCHEDVHRGALDQDCTRCHDIGKWTVTPGFSHDTTAYPLTNRHAAVKCDKCHLDARLSPRSDGRGHLIPVYKPVPHEACTDCHQDVHNGQFGPACTKCHSTRGWKQIDKQSFDHDRTRYPLRGQHASVRCASCHGDFATPASKKPAFQTCGACHKDVHAGTATLAGKPVDCDRCHTVSGFSPSSFTVDQHRNTKYALEGKHAAVRCSACHRKDSSPSTATKWGSAKVVIRPGYTKCLDCHADDHGGQLISQATHGECADCHRVLGWKPSSFDRSAHAKLRLPLDGHHAEIACRACHGADRIGLPALPPKVRLGKAAFLFKVAEVECAACHLDPHQGRFNPGGARAKERSCLTCHDTRSFRPSTADVTVHARFAFALEGAHRATACVSCHAELKPGAAPPARSSLVGGGARFGPLQFEAKQECVACHKSPHGDQFAARKDRGRCEACHDLDAFAPASRFDHDRDAAFSLKGAHERVPCNQCHHVDPRGGNPQAVIYRPLSAKCESCHGKESK